MLEQASAQPSAPPPPQQAQPAAAVLALQGDFAAHLAALEAHGVPAWPLRSVAQLAKHPPTALVLPGGESTTMLKLMDEGGLAEALQQLVHSGVPVLATCAGVILLAREVRHPSQASLGLLDVVVERNAYGRQRESVVTPVRVAPTSGLGVEWLEGVFIRAPRLVGTGKDVEVLAWRGEDPVLVRQGNILAATFHPELSRPSPVLALFARWVRGQE